MPTYWMNLPGGCNGNLTNLTTHTGIFQVIECRRAIYRRGGTRAGRADDWYTTGDCGGCGYNMLWLYSRYRNGIFIQVEAWTKFDNPSSAIAFVMDGDHNDGFAEFFVDEISVGVYDLYNIGYPDPMALVVDGLQRVQHTLRVRPTGTKNPLSKGFHAAIYCGLALS